MKRLRRSAIFVFVILGICLVVSTIALSNEYTCYIKAPDQDVYVRVFNVDDSRNKSDEIWSGVIPKYEQQSITSRTAYIIFDVRRASPEGPFKGGTSTACTGGGVIRVLP